MIEEIMRVWPLVAVVLIQAGGFLFWMGCVTADIKALKKHSDVSAKNGERLSNMEGKLDGIISSIDAMRAELPKRRGA